ncbi:MAG: transglutaminase domain-containing protein [Lachnospiraceae bacterium]|nr:transglutaminase domain-containing protein [Lachnospiraceae bacterium]
MTFVYKNEKVTDNIYGLTNLILLSLFLFFFINGMFWADLCFPANIFFFISAVILSNTVIRLPKRTRLYIFIIIFLIVLTWFFSSDKSFLYELYLRLPSIFPERSAENEAKRKILTVIITALMALPVSIINRLSERFERIRGFLSLLMIISLIYSLFLRISLHIVCVYSAFFYILIYITELIRKRGKADSYHRLKPFITGIIPFFLIFLLLLCAMPISKAPYKWQWARDIFGRIEEAVNIRLEGFGNNDSEDLDISFTGFSEKSGLFSNIQNKKKKLLDIRFSGKNEFPLYLKVQTFDHFNGRGWDEPKSDDLYKERIDLYESFCSLEAYNRQSGRGNYRNYKAEITYRYLHTDHLIIPMGTWNVEEKKNPTGYHAEGCDLKFDRKAGYGKEYIFQYLRPVNTRDEMKEYLISDTSPDEAVKKRITDIYDMDPANADELRDHRDHIYEKYSETVPLSPETERWLDEVTEGADSDIEKLYLLEEALSSMDYNSSPGRLPDNVKDTTSFLDHFLNVKREGFCTYYASAFVLLARHLGFPARYVQGFLIPAGKDPVLSCYSNMSHAWPEVYIEGKGFTAFEPTPGHTQLRYKRADKAKNLSAESPEVKKKEDGTDERKEEEDKGQGYTTGARALIEHYLIRVIAVILISVFIFIAVEFLYVLYREKKYGIEEKYYITVGRNLKILSFLGYERASFETYNELSERILSETEENPVPTDFIKVHEDIIYGNAVIDKEKLGSVIEQENTLLALLKNEKGYRYFFYYRKLFIR